MKTRIITSVYLVVALIVAFASRVLTPYIFDLLIGAMAIMGAVEMGRVFERSKQYNNIYLVGTFPAVLYVGFVVAFTNYWQWQYYLLLVLGLMAVYFVISFLISVIFKKHTENEISKYQSPDNVCVFALKKAINTSIIVVYPTLLFATMFLLNHLFDLRISERLINAPFDFYLLLTVFIVTMFTDSLALIVGRLVKGPKLCPRISPNKTISGAIGGLAGGVLGAFVVYWIFTINANFVTVFSSVASIWTVVLFGLIGSIISQLGDLFASFIKRRARVKDYGTLFPGHGGIMDRFDGMIFNSAFVMLYILILL